MLLKGLRAKNIYLAIVLIMLFKEHSDSWDINFGIQPVELSSFNYLCVYPGDQLTLDCTVQGGVATLWKGSTFDCSINLLHSGFSSRQQSPAGGECNNGKIVAHSIGGLNGTYISQLNVTVTKDMNNYTIITCAVLYPNGTDNVMVQNTLIIVDAVTAGLGIVLLACTERQSDIDHG